MLINKIGYSYNDVTIVPSIISDIKSRSECNPYVDENLPIFASPMASVVSENNYNIFRDNGIIPIIPRIKEYDINYRINLMHNGYWIAVSLKEFENDIIEYIRTLNKRNVKYNTFKVCVDIANGHMKSLYDTCCQAKQLAYDRHIKLIIMTGNIANAQTYEWICENAYYITTKNGYNYRECAIDYIRVGIGGGSGCITTSNVSIHYPQASLINECKKIKNEYENRYVRIFPAIIADGGIRNYDHVIKALALGADYVMIGSLFAQCIESAGEKFTNEIQKASIKFPIERYKNTFSIDSNENVKGYYTDEFIEENSKTWKNKVDEWEKFVEEGLSKDNADYKLVKLQYKDRLKELQSERFIGKLKVKFFGMASADGQKSMSGEKKKTAEGITKWLPVKYTLAGWVENMVSYLRSAMSYCDCKTLEEFIGKPNLIINSISEINAVNK